MKLIAIGLFGLSLLAQQFPGAQITSSSAGGGGGGGGTVTGVTATAPIVSSGGTAPVISGTYEGNGSKIQLFTGPDPAPNDCAKYDVNHNLTGAGAGCQAPLLFPTPGTSATLSGASSIFVCTGTCTVTVPVPAAGVQYCVMNDDNVATVITLSAIGSSARYENQTRTAYGTAGTGTFVSSGAVGDMVCILGRDSTHYLTASSNGTWTAN